MAGPNSIGEALGCAKSFGRLSECLAEWKKDATPAVTASAPDSSQPAASVLTGGTQRFKDANTIGDYGDPQNEARMKELQERQQRNRSSPGFG